jgi:ABC-type nitrate/sulfonate/bicarbonate transport system permease component
LGTLPALAQATLLGKALLLGPLARQLLLNTLLLLRYGPPASLAPFIELMRNINNCHNMLLTQHRMRYIVNMNASRARCNNLVVDVDLRSQPDNINDS